MIIDQLKNVDSDFYAGLLAGANNYGVLRRIKAALHFLQSTDLENLPVGRIELEGKQLFALVQEYNTKPRGKGFWEAHRQYIDVQYVVSGVEHMGYVNLAQMKVGTYDAKTDFLPMEGEGNFLVMPAGTFTIFAPQDGHMPGMAVSDPQPVKKVVVKVAIEGE